MKRKILSGLNLMAGLIFLAGSLQGLAQEPPPPPPPLPPSVMTEGEAGVSIVGPRVFFFETGGPKSRVVTGKPYSAEETTETTQVLADGNRIVHTETARMSRDGQGRTRRDRTLSNVGPWAVHGKPTELIDINDPVAGVRYMLNVDNKTAAKLMPPPSPSSLPSPPLPGTPGPNVLFYKKIEGSEPNFQRATESLGNRIIEGVLAQGTRTTMTIPADAVGNEKPIIVTDERWYAPALQLDVLTKHIDPRFGETDRKLANITLAEPDPSLFQVPPDYTVTDKPGGVGGIVTMRSSPKP